MASWYDKGDVGPDTDPNPLQGDGQLDDQHFLDTLFDGLEDDQFNQREPGLGTEFAGDDPSIWSIEGQAEEPERWTVTNPAVLSSEGAEMLKEIRENELLALRGIHIPMMEVPPGVDPATGEILFDDDAIPSFKESVAELEAIMAEVMNADQPEEPVGTLADIPVELIAEIAAELEEGVVEQAVDVDPNVSSLSAIEVIVSDIFRFYDAAETDETEAWWQDPAKLKAFLGISWNGFLNEEGGFNRQGFTINNPAWMSPDTKWDNPSKENDVQWWMEFRNVLPPPTYNWFSGEFGTSLRERLGFDDTGDASNAEFAAAIDSEEDIWEDPLSDSIYSALMAFSEDFIQAPTDLVEFQIVDDLSTGEWDEGLL